MEIGRFSKNGNIINELNWNFGNERINWLVK